MISIPPLATTQQDFAHSHSVIDALPHLGGMFMVLVTLVILWGLSVLISKLVSIMRPTPPVAFSPRPLEQTSGPSPSPVCTAPDANADHTPELVAVIAAAVTAYMGKPQRIVSIKPLSTAWERAGRQSVLTSHRIR